MYVVGDFQPESTRFGSDVLVDVGVSDTVAVCVGVLVLVGVSVEPLGEGVFDAVGVCDGVGALVLRPNGKLARLKCPCSFRRPLGHGCCCSQGPVPADGAPE